MKWNLGTYNVTTVDFRYQKAAVTKALDPQRVPLVFSGCSKLLAPGPRGLSWNLFTRVVETRTAIGSVSGAVIV